MATYRQIGYFAELNDIQYLLSLGTSKNALMQIVQETKKKHSAFYICNEEWYDSIDEVVKCGGKLTCDERYAIFFDIQDNIETLNADITEDCNNCNSFIDVYMREDN